MSIFKFSKYIKILFTFIATFVEYIFVTKRCKQNEELKFQNGVHYEIFIKVNFNEIHPTGYFYYDLKN